MSGEYEKILATLAESVSHTEDRIAISVQNYENAIDVLLRDQNGMLTHEQKSALRTLETVVAEVCYVSVLQHHSAGEHDSARRSLAVAKKVHEITTRALESIQLS